MFRKTLLIAALVTLVSASYAMAAGTTIVGGAHDFSDAAGGWAQGEICKPCHTPHHAQAIDISKRLWNHELTTATYTLRNGASGFNFDGTATGDAKDELDTASYLCMGCHDGTIALDAFGGATTAGGADTFIGNAGDLGIDRRMDHPVGLEASYGTTGTYASRYKPVTQSGSGTSTSYKVVVGANSLSLIKVTDAASSVNAVNSSGTAVSESGVKLVVGCRTCHNVHTNTDKLLNTVDNSASQLCLGCHNK